MTRTGAGVSVVVPVFNPGPYLDRTVASLLSQTLPAQRCELIFVDDGSTDGSSRMLDKLAEEHPDLVRVTHIPNSGWPGRPRNVGTDLARFDYVFYCDADDWLPDDALDTLLARAEQDGSDLVVSRVVGNRRAVPQAIFELGDFATTWQQTPGVFNNLTIQKLFRREFLREHGLRFAEGRVRLEDFTFMLEALLRSERISVLGSRPCYVLEKRDDGKNLTSTPAELADYRSGVERLLDIIEQHTEPGWERDLALDRPLRSEVIRSATGPAFLRRVEAERVEVFDWVRGILRDRIPQTAITRLNATARRQVRAILDGDRGLVERWIEWDAAVAADMRFTAATWTDGRLRLDIEVALLRDVSVIELTRSGDRLFAPGPPGMAPDEPGMPAGVDVSAEIGAANVHVALRSRDTGELWRAQGRCVPAPGARQADRVALQWRATVEIDFSTLAGGRPLRRQIWDPYVQVGACGLSRELQPPLDAAVPQPPVAVLGGLVVSSYNTAKKLFAFELGQATRALGTELVRRGFSDQRIEHDRLLLDLPMTVHGAPAEVEVELTPIDSPNAEPHTATATIAPGPAPVPLEVKLPRLGRAARWSIGLRYGDAEQATAIGLDIVRPRRGSATLVASADQPAAAGSAPRRSWRGLAFRVARRLGLSVGRVGPGAVLVSRSRDGYQTEPVVLGSVYLAARRRAGKRRIVRLKPGVAVVAAAKERAPAVRHMPVTSDAWLVGVGDSRAAQVDIARIGKRAALVAERDASPRAALTLETETMQHLGARHVSWLLDSQSVDCVIDVGANNGQYAQGLRRQGYRGHIVSVEPVPAFADKLRQLAAADPAWTVHEVALGESDGVVPIRVQRTFSSALPASEYGKKRFATLRDFADDEQIEVPLRRLESVWDEWLAPVVATGVRRPRVFLKMDTQGFDLQVFGGLGARVADLVGLQSEVALLLIYEQMPRMPQAVATYEAAGFEITGLYPVTREPDGRVIEYDCTMVRAERLKAS